LPAWRLIAVSKPKLSRREPPSDVVLGAEHQAPQLTDVPLR
jgi:hypothetical protein